MSVLTNRIGALKAFFFFGPMAVALLATGGKWEHAPRSACFRCASTRFIQTFKNKFFNRNL